jgi:HAD superfamily hydrolase (TIGR01509 family)
VNSKTTYFPYQAVIFDLDGVLADTEPLNFRAIQDMFDPAKLLLDDQDFIALYGLDYFDTADYLRNRYHLSESTASLASRQETCAIKRIDLELEPAPGSLDFIRSLAAHHIPLGLASNSPNAYVYHALHRLTVDRFIPYPVGRNDVARGKPAPDPYLEACARVSADPTRSLAVEDSTVGMQAALAAGMSVALIGPHAPVPPTARVTRYADIVQLTSALMPI